MNGVLKTSAKHVNAIFKEKTCQQKLKKVRKIRREFLKSQKYFKNFQLVKSTRKEFSKSQKHAS